MPRTRPPYPPEFRREAVRMVRSSGRPISEAARELGVSAESLRKWVKQTEVDAATREEIASIRAESGGDGGGELSAPLGRLKSGRLVFANGTLRLNLRAAGMADLYRASFEGPAPKVEAEDGTVTVRYSWGFRALKWRGHSGEVTLNAAVPWEVEMRGGASEIEADLGGVVLSSFVLKGGDQRPGLDASGTVGGGPDTSVGGCEQGGHTPSRRGRGAGEHEGRRQQANLRRAEFGCRGREGAAPEPRLRRGIRPLRDRGLGWSKRGHDPVSRPQTPPAVSGRLLPQPHRGRLVLIGAWTPIRWFGGYPYRLRYSLQHQLKFFGRRSRQVFLS